jgi:hypothetical protein
MRNILSKIKIKRMKKKLFKLIGLVVLVFTINLAYTDTSAAEGDREWCFYDINLNKCVIKQGNAYACAMVVCRPPGGLEPQ